VPLITLKSSLLSGSSSIKTLPSRVSTPVILPIHAHDHTRNLIIAIAVHTSATNLTVNTPRPLINPLPHLSSHKVLRRKILIKQQTTNRKVPTFRAIISLRHRDLVSEDSALAISLVAVAVALLAALGPEFFGGCGKVEVGFVERVVGSERRAWFVAGCAGHAAVGVGEWVCYGAG
jgi:hypothetical protein